MVGYTFSVLIWTDKMKNNLKANPDEKYNLWSVFDCVTGGGEGILMREDVTAARPDSQKVSW